MVAIMALSPGCKPADEPSRAEGVEPNPDVGMISPRGSDDAAVAALGRLRVVMHDDDLPKRRGPSETQSGDPNGARERSPEKPTPSEELEPENTKSLDARITEARKAATGDAERQAKRLNKEGLAHHKRLELSQALKKYGEALRAWPGHLYARYNRACAYALLKKPGPAMDELEILRGLKDRGGLDMLRSARLDEDFTTLRTDGRFRELTGYVPVQVATNKEGGGERIDLEVSRLRAVHIPATRAAPWDRSVEVDTLYVRDDDVAAGHMADEITDAFPTPLSRRLNSRLGPKRPVVLVLTSSPQPLPEDTPTEAHDPEAFIGVQLVRQEDGILERLHLKARRFFTWETRHDDGTHVARTGTYYFLRGKLHLDFQQTTETPTDEEPKIEILRGKREHHRVSTDGIKLTVGDRVFARE